jgi:hypothetical protein
VTIKDSDLTGAIALNVWGKNCVINVENTRLNTYDASTAEGYSTVKLNNDGTTSAKPVKTLSQAYTKIDGNGTVVICSSVTLSSADLPTGQGRVTLTSVYGGVNYKNSGASLTIGTDIYLGSDMTIENVALSYSSSRMIFCQGHSLKLGEGITTSSSATPPRVFGGTNLSKSGVNVKNSQFFDFTLEVCSGKWYYVTCGNYRTGEDTIIGVIGNANLIINGGTFTATGRSDSERENVSGIAGSALHGDLYMEINGGTFASSVFGAAFCGMNGSRRIPGHLGDIHMVINGGTFNGTQIAAVQEKLNFLDGDFYLDMVKEQTYQARLPKYQRRVLTERHT